MEPQPIHYSAVAPSNAPVEHTGIYPSNQTNKRNKELTLNVVMERFKKMREECEAERKPVEDKIAYIESLTKASAVPSSVDAQLSKVYETCLGGLKTFYSPQYYIQAIDDKTAKCHCTNTGYSYINALAKNIKTVSQSTDEKNHAVLNRWYMFYSGIIRNTLVPISLSYVANELGISLEDFTLPSHALLKGYIQVDYESKTFFVYDPVVTFLVHFLFTAPQEMQPFIDNLLPVVLDKGFYFTISLPNKEVCISGRYFAKKEKGDLASSIISPQTPGFLFNPALYFNVAACDSQVEEQKMWQRRIEEFKETFSQLAIGPHEKLYSFLKENTYFANLPFLPHQLANYSTFWLDVATKKVQELIVPVQTMEGPCSIIPRFHMMDGFIHLLASYPINQLPMETIFYSLTQHPSAFYSYLNTVPLSHYRTTIQWEAVLPSGTKITGSFKGTETINAKCNTVELFSALLQAHVIEGKT